MLWWLIKQTMHYFDSNLLPDKYTMKNVSRHNMNEDHSTSVCTVGFSDRESSCGSRDLSTELHGRKTTLFEKLVFFSPIPHHRSNDFFDFPHLVILSEARRGSRHRSALISFVKHVVKYSENYFNLMTLLGYFFHNNWPQVTWWATDFQYTVPFDFFKHHRAYVNF